MAKDDRVSVRLSSELKAALERLAKADDRTLASYIERALRDHVSAAQAWKRPAKRK